MPTPSGTGTRRRARARRTHFEPQDDRYAHCSRCERLCRTQFRALELHGPQPARVGNELPPKLTYGFDHACTSGRCWGNSTYHKLAAVVISATVNRDPRVLLAQQNNGWQKATSVRAKKNDHPHPGKWRGSRAFSGPLVAAEQTLRGKDKNRIKLKTLFHVPAIFFQMIQQPVTERRTEQVSPP
jgi:hypothetical protein